MLLLAETQPPADALASWLSVLMYLAGLVAAVSVAWHFLTGAASRRTITPDPLTVSAAKEYVPRPEFDRHRQEVDERFTAATAARKKLHEAHERIGRELASLHVTAEHTSKEINQLREQLTNADERHDKALDKIHDRIDHLPARIAEQMRALRPNA